MACGRSSHCADGDHHPLTEGRVKGNLKVHRLDHTGNPVMTQTEVRVDTHAFVFAELT